MLCQVPRIIDVVPPPPLSLSCVASVGPNGPRVNGFLAIRTDSLWRSRVRWTSSSSRWIDKRAPSPWPAVSDLSLSLSLFASSKSTVRLALLISLHLLHLPFYILFFFFFLSTFFLFSFVSHGAFLLGRRRRSFVFEFVITCSTTSSKVCMYWKAEDELLRLAWVSAALVCPWMKRCARPCDPFLSYSVT